MKTKTYTSDGVTTPEETIQSHYKFGQEGKEVKSSTTSNPLVSIPDGYRMGDETLKANKDIEKARLADLRLRNIK